ncbi:hypothetical protein [Consotaella salsifontis]|uniref:hypothetical protein n=1 Tax=Consotaella salsifontis TaxID=1365950 RepID=UPI001FD98A9A|nr:hypothetical protein [Consotaella salsifontis]
MENTVSIRSGGARWLHAPSPLLVIVLVLLCLGGLLSLPLTVPIGPSYWDLFIYFDAANRIFDGQMPSVDFFAPVGPLGYWLFAFLIKLWPNAQPLLLVQWSLLLITAPLMVLVSIDVDRRSRGLALALLIPFLVFSVLPVNIEEYSHFPSLDGYGIYNRQGAELLYVLTSALVLVRGRKTQLAVVALAALALFLAKITGFIGGMGLCLFAFAAGRLAFPVALGAGVVFMAGLAALELLFGIVSAYIADIATLVSINEGELLPRFLQAASIHFSVFAAGGLLVLVLLFIEMGASARPADGARAGAIARVQRFLDRDWLWLAVTLFVGLFFETQNTGGQGFIFLWPVLLVILGHANRYHGRRLVALLALVGATALPTTVDIVARSARALVGQVKYERLEHDHLKTLGSVNQRSEFMDHAKAMLDIYARYPAPYEALAEAGQLPSFTLYTDPDFQLTWLMSVDEAADAILKLEAQSGQRFATIMNLNFVNPFPWLLDRHATRLIAIGADPFRAVPPPSEAVLAEVAKTDLVLYPKCPVTTANQALLDIYRKGLTGHRVVSLTPCWDAYVRGDITLSR